MKRVPVIFFRTLAGNEPVREWLLALPDDDRREIGRGVRTVEYGWPIGMPLCRPMGEGLHEIRISLDHRIARIMFYVDVKGRLVLLHGFIKKSQKAPAADLVLARQRKAQHEGSLV